MNQFNLRFQKETSLIPVIIQNIKSRDILMLGYMNKEAFQKTLKTGWVYFWSRSRKRLWLKGEESGNKLKVKSIFLDCDRDTLLIEVELTGESACHTGNKTCLFNKLKERSYDFGRTI